jgi:hypothetical protein
MSNAMRPPPGIGGSRRRKALDARGLLALLLAVLLNAACAPRPMAPADPSPGPEAACRCLLADLDRIVNQAEVGYAGSLPVAGFPYLRTNRFLAAMARRADDRGREALLERLLELGLEARRREIQALEADSRSALQRRHAREAADEEALTSEVARCAKLLLAADRQNAGFHSRLQNALAHLPDEYAGWRRLVGFYPLAALPVAFVSDRAFDEIRRQHRTPESELPQQGRLVTYAPAGSAPDRESLKPLFAPANRDALGLPHLDPADTLRLARAYAPWITQDTTADYDRIGAIRWGAPRQPLVDTRHPMVYFYLSQTFHKSLPTVQINYVFWYPRRNGPATPWIERGAIDGLTVRVNLDPDGVPFLVDIMHSCGCYHFFLPDWRRTARIVFRPPSLSPLVPAWMPPDFPARPLRLRVSSGWHQVLHVATGGTARETTAYALEPYARLEALPREDGPPRSVFDHRGRMPGTERFEDLLFFSMGIPAVGQMRQRGHHATQFVGREIFDDPGLLDRHFEFR